MTYNYNLDNYGSNVNLSANGFGDGQRTYPRVKEQLYINFIYLSKYMNSHINVCKSCYNCIRSKCAEMEWTELVKGIDKMVKDLMVYLGKSGGDSKLDILGECS